MSYSTYSDSFVLHNADAKKNLCSKENAVLFEKKIFRSSFANCFISSIFIVLEKLTFGCIKTQRVDSVSTYNQSLLLKL